MLGELIQAHDIAGAGVVYRDENVVVTAAEVPHGAAAPSYAYRIDTAGGSVVFSGDTTMSDALVELATGADVLVHEVVSIDGAAAIMERLDPGNGELLRHIIGAHTPPGDVGRVAARAGVERLVLTHFVPTGLPEFDRPELWLAAVRPQFAGEIIVGRDLLEIAF